MLAETFACAMLYAPGSRSYCSSRSDLFIWSRMNVVENPTKTMLAKTVRCLKGCSPPKCHACSWPHCTHTAPPFNRSGNLTR
jgi:hypothetical protein